MPEQPLLLRNNAFNFIQHMLNAGHHILGCKADHMKILAVQPRGTSRIVKHLSRFGVLIAINFNHQSNWQTAEIGKVGSKCKLASKAMAMNNLAAKVAPQFLFGL